MKKGILLLTGKTDKRITPFGRFLRKHKFDEIPNLLMCSKEKCQLSDQDLNNNILLIMIIQKGSRYRLLQMIKPGITSWGQIKYGYASNVEDMIERLEYDLYYLENRSFLFDLKIALNTITIALRGKGI